MTLDNNGNVLLGGRTGSKDFPVTPKTYDTSFDACYETGWVALLDNKKGQILWSTFLGGRHRDFVSGLAVDSRGRIWAAGGTESSDFLDFIHQDPAHQGGVDLFLCALDPRGKKLLYETLLGGRDDDVPGAFAFREKQGFYFGGWTWSENFEGLAYPGGELKDGPWGFLLFKAMPTL